jgi:hypothetical protein
MAHLKSLFLGLLGLRKHDQAEPIPREAVIRNLLDARAVLNSLGITFWLTDGTLLGYFREGDILRHDRDIDLGLMIESYTDDIAPAFVEMGFDLMYVLGEKRQGLELSFVRDSVKVDLFFFYREGDRLWHGAWEGMDKGRKRNLIKYYYDPFELKQIEFLGARFTVPADTLKYVETKYGKSWSTPVKDWDWAMGPANAVRTGVVLERNKKKIIR